MACAGKTPVYPRVFSANTRDLALVHEHRHGCKWSIIEGYLDIITHLRMSNRFGKVYVSKRRLLKCWLVGKGPGSEQGFSASTECQRMCQDFAEELDPRDAVEYAIFTTATIERSLKSRNWMSM